MQGRKILQPLEGGAKPVSGQPLACVDGLVRSFKLLVIHPPSNRYDKAYQPQLKLLLYRRVPPSISRTDFLIGFTILLWSVNYFLNESEMRHHIYIFFAIRNSPSNRYFVNPNIGRG